jgi:hypothetical protein
MNNENLTNAGQGQPRKNYKQVTLGLPDRTLAILDKHKASMPSGKRTRNELLIAIVDLIDSGPGLMAELSKPTIPSRQVTYALFDPTKVSSGLPEFIHQSAFVGTVVGFSRQSVERSTGLKAVPLGRLTVRERKWVNDKEKSAK